MCYIESCKTYILIGCNRNANKMRAMGETRRRRGEIVDEVVHILHMIAEYVQGITQWMI